MNFEELDISEHRQEFLTDDNTPDTWPDLHRMFIDDQDRLWIFTITESKTSYQGWVLNTDGELLARFSWPGRRSSRSVRSKPIMVVKNGYLYTSERNMDEGIDRIVKHKINFKKQ